MKTSRLASAVVAGHLVVLGIAIVGTQGCGTTTGHVSSTPPPEPPMPGVEETLTPEPVVKQRPVAPAVVPPAKSWSDEMTPYTVQKGDSVSLICARFGVSRAEVMALNHIKDANKIAVGQTLQLPGKVNLSAPKPVSKPKAAPAAKVDKPAAAPAAVASGEGVYVVKAGDVLSRIASRNGTTVTAIKSANGLTSDRINVGQKLKLTGGAAAPAAAVEVAPAVSEAPAPSAAPAAGVEGDADMLPAPSDAPAAPAVAPSYKTYTVGPNEDLFHVSLMWGVEISELQRVNGLGTNTTLVPGQQVQIPLAP